MSTVLDTGAGDGWPGTQAESSAAGTRWKQATRGPLGHFRAGVARNEKNNQMTETSRNAPISKPHTEGTNAIPR